MKVTVEVDCTPAEAREFMGLPDVAPLQAAVMKEMEHKVMAEMERFSPDALLKGWFSFAQNAPEQAQEFFSKLVAQGISGKHDVKNQSSRSNT